ncbi:hypothetical protein KC332_g6075 [Hortaea werneckii]|nr:hypothetical protein KC358_g5895 [Hortaea werneckii]KAI6841826.1 hypothetical protein KC350_g5178 [Hortaea werneckii]KAI6935628.1 hypothetical protein KC348_g6203 [Hortaea werneckii]KAI6937233.1 hypothetical protein KC341_g5713 [Hortaea werneckii]KAI6970046.1 hypothetical protein KC321_g7536 [Hortaea werneckii]
MERAWAWLRSCFGSRTTDRAHSPDRVEHGRVEKRSQLSRSPKRRHASPRNGSTRSSPSSKKRQIRPTCESFAETLLRVVRRDANLKLLNRLAQDINGSIEHLDELIEQEQGRVEAEADVHKRHVLRDWLRKCHADRESLRRDRMRNDRNLQSATAEQQDEEAAVFDQAAWAMEHCAGQAAAAVLDDGMLSEMDRILDAEDELTLRGSTLAAAKEEYADLRAALDNIAARRAHDAAAALDRLFEHLQGLEAGKDVDSRALLVQRQSLWSRVRQSMLANGTMALDDGRLLPDPEPVQQDPPSDDVPTYEQFEEARDSLDRIMSMHDRRQILESQWIREFKENYPDATPSEADRGFRRQSRTRVHLINEREQRFVDIRDRILPTGAQHLALAEFDRGRLEFPEFRGDCPSDGKTDSEASNVKRFKREQFESAAKLRVESWLNTESGHAQSDPECCALKAPLVDEASYERLKASYALRSIDPAIPARPSYDKKEHEHLIESMVVAENIRMAILPWDSLSAAERRPYLRNVVDERKKMERL